MNDDLAHEPDKPDETIETILREGVELSEVNVVSRKLGIMKFADTFVGKCSYGALLRIGITQ